MRNWKTAWGVAAADYNALELQTEDFTITIKLPAAFPGTGIRLRLTNRYGRQPLKIDALTILAEGGRFSITLQGETEFELPAGCEICSDILQIPVTAGELLEITVSIPGKQLISDIGCSMYPIPVNSDYTGNITVCSRNPRYQAFAAPLAAPGFKLFVPVAGVDILTEEPAKTLAVFGDSLVHMNMWTGPLAEKLMKTGRWGVCNCGISGNRLLRDTVSVMGGEMFGEAGIRRFERDVFQSGNADVVILSIGANDIIHPVQFGLPEETVRSWELAEGLTRCAEIAHEHGAKILVGNIVPCGGAAFWNESIEQTRREVNEWISDQKIFDGFLDFASVVACRENPMRYREDYHVGDFLHMNQAGGRAAAEMVLEHEIFRLPETGRRGCDRKI